MSSPAVQYIHDAIIRDIFVPRSKEYIYPESSTWLMDFRKVAFDPDFLDAFGEAFYERFQNELPFQVGGMEVAAVPLVTAVVLKFREKGKPISGFFVRKSRKKEGLLHMIEGKFTHDPVILIDDLINRGYTFERQIAVVEQQNVVVKAVFCALRFRTLDTYPQFSQKNIPIVSIFTLDDFQKELGTKTRLHLEASQVTRPIFDTEWVFRSSNPLLASVQPKSGIAFDSQRIYFGSDKGTFWALEKITGKVVWQFELWPKPGKEQTREGKQIFSSPSLYQGRVYFGSYDGNVYCLDAETGERQWVSFEADWTSGSPLLLLEEGVLIVPAAFGLWHKSGGIIALDLKMGEKRWEQRFKSTITATPIYLNKQRNQIIVVSHDGLLRAIDPKTGESRWSFQARKSILGAPAYDGQESLVVPSMDGNIYMLDATNGHLRWRYENGLGNYSSPIICDRRVYIASLDKHVYCLDLATGKEIWKFRTRARVFASPRIYGGKLYIGSNDARLYELDPKTGRETGYFQVTERITNPLYHDPEADLFYLVTYANEVYCLKKKSRETLERAGKG
jgi:outer membrane protein assembly factor BamB/orotate phosphoribosyltransferase